MSTTRYAPALYVGLGGSGTKILRWLKATMQLECGSSLDSEPVVFRAFDLDPASNQGEDVEPLTAGEFHWLHAERISDCVRALYTEKSGFPEIREWYPDLAGEHIAFAQAEAAGAGQWRPLGRIGFFVHPNEIHSSLSDACSVADARRQSADDTRPQVWIISSLGGGTGSGMLFDFAMAFRQIRSRFYVRTFLLLPELFENIAFKPNLLANTCAALRELAAYTTQRFFFMPSYPPPFQSVTRRTAVQPFDDVLLVGPYAGRKQPFRRPDEAYAYLAHTVEAASIRESRSGARSDNANNHLGGISRQDEASTHVFGSLSGLGIPLLTFAELADFCLMTLAAELRDPIAQHSMFDLLQPPIDEKLAENALRRLMEMIGFDPQNDLLSKERFTEELTKWVKKWAADNGKREDPRKWDADALKAFGREFESACGLGKAPLGPQSLLGERVANAQAECQHAIDGLGVFAHPYRRRLWVDRIRRRLPPRPTTVSSRQEPPRIADFVQWLKGSVFDRFYRRAVLPVRVRRLIAATADYYDALGTEGRRAVYDAAVRRVVEEKLSEAETYEEKQWELANAFSRDLLRTVKDPWTERRNAVRFVTSPRVQGAASIIAREFQRYAKERGDVERLREDILKTFVDAYEEYKVVSEKERPAKADALVRVFRRKFVEALAFSPLMGGLLPYVPAGSLFDAEEITAMVAACDNPVFRPGQWEGRFGKRIARIIVPKLLVEHEQKMRELAGATEQTHISSLVKDVCQSRLGAQTAQSLSADTTRDAAICVLIEDVSRPAQQLEHLAVYEESYRRKSSPDLFHIERGLSASLPPLLNAAQTQTPHRCGNPGCRRDLRGVPPEVLFCAGCRNPIRTRCGNPGCSADPSDFDSTQVPLDCLACGRPLRTYWWVCDRHGAVSMDKQSCPRCLKEGTAGGTSTVHRRPDAEHLFVCPGCHVVAGAPAAYTGAVIQYLRFGASAADEQNARTSFGEVLAHGRSCRRCGAATAPYCPGHSSHLAAWDAETRRFVCNLDKHQPLFTCGSCSFVLSERDVVCPRCRTALEDCRFCTRELGIRVSATGLRCTRCHLQKTPLHALEPSCRGTPGETFCTNIFGCRVGAHLLDATFSPAVTICIHCEHPVLRPFDVITRGAMIRACAYCSALFGTEDGDSAAQVEGICCLCGRAPADVQNLKGNVRAWKTAIAIGRALIDFPDDEGAFRAIIKAHKHDPFGIDELLRVYMRDIRSTAIATIVRDRLERILAMYARTFDCRKVKSDLPQCGCDHDVRTSTGAGAPPGPPTESGMSTKDLLAPETLMNLDSEAKVDRWKEHAHAAGVKHDEIVTALGTLTGRIQQLDQRLGTRSTQADGSDADADGA